MLSLKNALTPELERLGINPKTFSKAASNNKAYMESVKFIWKSRSASKMILDHTNAFYVRVDKTPRKGKYKDMTFYVAEIVVDDPVVRAEIDTHRELLDLQLNYRGIFPNEIKILYAKGNMRNRHPFSSDKADD